MMIVNRHLPEFFKDCVLISTSRARVPHFGVVNGSRFNVIYGGHRFELFDGSITSSAWVAFKSMIAVTGRFLSVPRKL